MAVAVAAAVAVLVVVAVKMTAPVAVLPLVSPIRLSKTKSLSKAELVESRPFYTTVLWNNVKSH